MIAKHEYAQGQWGELNQFIIQHCNSPDPGLREVRKWREEYYYIVIIVV